MAQNPRTTDAESAPTTGRNYGLSRRNYVRSLAAVATAATSLGAAGSVAAQDDGDYEVIEATGQTIQVGSGETWENKLIDMTTGGDIVVSAYGTDWTIRNIGFKGKNTSGTGSATFGICDEGGSSTIENIYLGDGTDGRNGADTGHGQTAFWVDPKHSGHIDFKHLNIQKFADNAIYGSAPGSNGGGTLHIDQSFAANCRVSHFRVASEGCKVTNSSVYVDNEEGYQGRGIWAWAPGTIEIDNCQIQMNGAHTAIDAGANGNPTEVVVTDSDYDEQAGIAENAGSNVQLENTGTEPEAFIPEGVPTSPEEAAGGDD
ncbi:hypothetical protein [Halopiger xanaduensis]|uniref:Right handed beta helix domain-containing protein n=1 Tax=Halopiger xanaduensis (strain DSM 18323 / JCM 14033 / SH-6) TaxID=797210 RepID=F8D5V3_HALXS|nr:hypothetical protein [Halopiger xanaduensis]AEH37679.1 hypothetical protein Halxa_3064 [Halopiger xanaduensis SH-6]